MIQDVLRRIGLTSNEIKVYIALIDLGKATSGKILQKANLNTGKIYDILGALKKKGFISEITESGVKHFSPANPKQIFSYLDERKKEVQLQEDSLNKILPSLLKKINESKSSPKVEVFYGINGLKTAHYKESERYSSKQTLRIFGIMGREKYASELYDYYIYNLYAKRKKSKVKTKKILDTAARKYRKDHEENALIKYFPYVSPVAIVTIADLTIIDIVIEDPIVITIESKEVADSFIQQFELLWKLAKT